MFTKLFLAMKTKLHQRTPKTFQIRKKEAVLQLRLILEMSGQIQTEEVGSDRLS